MSKPKIVLAYSGGLDTSVLVRILGEEYGYDVIACHADVGEAKDLAAAEPAKAKELKALWDKWNAEQKAPLWVPNPAKKKKNKNEPDEE